LPCNFGDLRNLGFDLRERRVEELLTEAFLELGPFEMRGRHALANIDGHERTPLRRLRMRRACQFRAAAGSAPSFTVSRR